MIPSLLIFFDFLTIYACNDFLGPSQSLSIVGPSGGSGRLSMSRDGLDGALRSSFSGGSPTRWKHSSRVGFTSGTSKSGDFGQRQNINTISGKAVRRCSV